MRNRIRRANRKRTIQYSRQKRHTAAPSRRVLPVSPHKCAACVLGRHCCNHDDRHQSAYQDEEQSGLLHPRYDMIPKHAHPGPSPRNPQEGNICMPRLYLKPWVENNVELRRDIRGDADNGGEVEDPAEEVQPAGEETEDAAPARVARGQGGPVVDAAGGGDGGSEFGDGGGDEGVVEASGEEFVEDAGGTAVYWEVVRCQKCQRCICGLLMAEQRREDIRGKSW